MELLLLFLGLGVASGVVIWWSTRATGYRVKNRDVAPQQTSSTRGQRPELDLDKMLD